MKFTILLVSLILQAFSGVNLKKSTYRFLEWYAARMKPLLARYNADHALRALIGLLTPILVLIILLNLIFGRINSMYFVYSVIILLFSLDVCAVKNQLNAYWSALASENLAQAQAEAEEFVEHPLHLDKGGISRAVTETILIKSETYVFAIIFWFMLLGPFGVVLYYLVAAITERAQEPEFGFSDIYSLAEYIKEMLDWLPVRIVSLTFALIGHFAPVFAVWLDRVGGGLMDNRQLLIDSGLTAIHADEFSQAPVVENQQALHLVTRTLWTWMIVLGLFSLL